VGGSLSVARNELIDGWRGISVLLVIIAHLITYRFPGPVSRPVLEIGLSTDLAAAVFFRLLSPIGELGVQFFFVISGFLITTLLISEERHNGQISVGAFYIRRIFRIMPAFLVFITMMLLLRSTGLVSFDNEAVARTATFTCNFSGFDCSWWFGHTWSLSVEEQFYLVWPVLFVLAGQRRVLILTFLSVELMAASLLYPGLTSFAHVAVGCLVAAHAPLREVMAKYVHTCAIGVAAAVLLFKPLLPGWFGVTSAIDAVAPLMTAIVFFGTIYGKGPFLALVNSPTLQKLGLISYSVYLWQQIGTAPDTWNGTITGAANLYYSFGLPASLFILPAIASYLLIERPLIAIGRSFSARLVAARSAI
jgi:peptidoglycan/LPS O-acetylase OafA/YrhL